MNLLKVLALSPAQFNFLKGRHGKFMIGDSLRKRGLLERYTTFVMGAEYATEAGITNQYTNRKPQPQHEWSTTTAGDLLLEFIEKHT